MSNLSLIGLVFNCFSLLLLLSCLIYKILQNSYLNCVVIEYILLSLSDKQS